MTEFFDPGRFQSKPINEGVCWGCTTPWDNCDKTLQLKQDFTRLTGKKWGDLASWSVPVKEDLASLGRAADHVPPTVDLCLRCVVEYLKKFNRELARRKVTEVAKQTYRDLTTEQVVWCEEARKPSEGAKVVPDRPCEEARKPEGAKAALDRLKLDVKLMVKNLDAVEAAWETGGLPSQCFACGGFPVAHWMVGQSPLGVCLRCALTVLVPLIAEAIVRESAEKEALFPVEYHVTVASRLAEKACTNLQWADGWLCSKKCSVKSRHTEGLRRGMREKE